MQPIIQLNNDISYLVLSIFFDREFFWHFFIFGIFYIFFNHLRSETKFTYLACAIYVIISIIYFSSDVGIFSESNLGALTLGFSIASLAIIAKLTFKFRGIIARSASSIISCKPISIKLKEKAKKLFYDAANNRL